MQDAIQQAELAHGRILTNGSMTFGDGNTKPSLHTHARLTHILSLSVRSLVIDGVAAFPELRVASVTVGVALGQPARAFPRLKIRLAVHDVDLLERKRFGLVQEEVDHDAGGQVGAAEDEAEAVADAVGGVGGEETNHEVAWDTLAGLSGEMDEEMATYPASCLLLREMLALPWCGEGWIGTLAEVF